MSLDAATTAAIVLAAGSGERLAAGIPKALHPLGDSTILEHAVRGIDQHPRVGHVLVVAPADHRDDVSRLIRHPVVTGGVTRQDSVRRALGDLPDHIEVVLVHDAARPFVPAPVVDRVLDALADGADAAVPCLPVSDTIKRISVDGHVVGTVDRSELRAVQTPQGFVLERLLAAHRYARTSGLTDVTDDSALVERHGGRVVLVDGSTESFKITVPFDLGVAEFLLRRRTAADRAPVS